MPIDVGTAQGHLDLDISGFLKNLKTAQSEAQATVGTAEQTLSKSFTSVGDKLSSAGRSLTLGLTVPIAGIATVGMKVATEFEASMSQVKAISGATGEDFERLRNKAMDLGASTAYNAKEVADAMTEMAKAGWDTNQIMDGMEGVLDAASASGENLATVATIVADSITGFGMEAKESTRVADILTHSANAGTIEISDLGESFKYVAPIAQSMGISIEDAATAITAMSTAGIKGSSAGTSLRRMLTNLVKPSEDISQAMDELGINITNSDGSFKSLDEIVAILRTSFSGLTDEQKSYYAATIAGTAGQSGMLALLNLSEEEYGKLSEEMNNCSGEAHDTAAVMRDNLKLSLKQLTGALESLAIKLAENVIPWLTNLARKATEMVDKFKSMDEGTQRTILKIAAFVAALGPALSIIGKMSTGIGALMKIPQVFSSISSGATTFSNAIKNIPEAFTLAKAGFTGFASQTSALGTALAGITAPMLAIGAAIAVVIAAFATLMATTEEFRNKIQEIFGGMVEKFQEFTQGIVDRINALGFNFKDILEVLGAAWNFFCNMLAPVFIAVFEVLSAVFSGVLDVITGILDVFIGLFTGNWDQFWKGIQEIFSGIWNMIVSIFQTVGNLLGTIWTTIAGFLTNVAMNIVNGIVGFFQELPGKILEFFNNIFNSAVEWGSNMLNKAGEIGRGFVDNVVNFISSLPGSIMNFFGNIIGSAASFAGDFAGRALDAGRQFFDNIVNEVSNIPNRMLSIGSDIVNGVWNGIQNAAGWFRSSIEGFFGGIVDGAKHALGIASPSKVMRKQVGRWIPPGISKGFEDEMPNAIDDMQDSIDDGIKKLKTDVDIGEDIADSVTDVKFKFTPDYEDAFKDVIGKSTFGDVFDFAGMLGNALPNVNNFESLDNKLQIDYARLALEMSRVLKDAPIVPNVVVEMEDGDVFMDAERVGRKVSPVVSRVISKDLK